MSTGHLVPAGRSAAAVATRWSSRPVRERRSIGDALLRGAKGIVDAWAEVVFDPARLAAHGVPGLESQTEATLRTSYLEPLVRMLAGFARTGEWNFLDAYRDERLRYAPHRTVAGGPPMHADPGVRAAYFAEILPAGEDACRAAIRDLAPAASEALDELFRELHAPLLEPPVGTPLRLLAVGDCLMGELRLALPRALESHGVTLDMRTLYFSAVLGSSISSDQVAAAAKDGTPDAVAFSFFTYEALAPWSALLREADSLRRSERRSRVEALLEAVRVFLSEVREVTEAPFLVHDACGLPLARERRWLPLLAPHSRGRLDVLNRMRAGVEELTEANPNTLLVSESELVERKGIRELGRPTLPAGVIRGSMFHALRFGPALAAPYLEILRARALTLKTKLLLLDFDNTLWDGVMADSEVEHYRERQRMLKSLKDGGILLAAVSKNTESNIRWDETELTPEDFAIRRINWNLKVQSIREIASELDLGFDSFVLVDDNPAERELVRSELPEVGLLDSDDPWAWRALGWLADFPNTKDTEVARRRTEMYREQAERRRATAGAVDYPSMMRSLKLWTKFGPAREKDLPRVGELIQRTNQFNTTTIRYDRARIDAFHRDDGWGLWTTEMGDKFGSHGLVMVVLVRRGEPAEFDSVVMSCRAMGYGLEQWTLARVMREERATGYRGRFVPTDRNDPAAGLYESCGFVESEPGLWTRAADPPLPEPDWIRELKS